jgi:hypothetical protein
LFVAVRSTCLEKGRDMYVVKKSSE